MQTSEIKELYAQKTGAPPGPAVSKFIDTLKVREVAKIWSAMGEGEDFIGAIKRIIGDQIRKAGGEGDINDMDLDANLRKLEELKKKQELEAKQLAEEKKRERERLAEEKKRREQEEVERKLREEEEKKQQEEQQRKQAEAAAEKRRDAERKEAAAKKAEEEAKAAQEAAARAMAAAEAAAREREAADQAEAEAAAKRMEEARLAKEVAEQAEREARARAQAEKEAAEAALKRVQALNEAQEMMKVVLEQQKREREEQEKIRQKEREEAERKLAEAEAEARELEARAQGQESEDEDAGKTEEEVKRQEEDLSAHLTIRRKDKDENLGIHGLIAVCGKVRAIELLPNGACDRAGMKAASVIREVNGMAITDKESLVEAVNQVRQEGLLEFQIIVEPPLTSDELSQDLDKVKEERKKRAKEQVMKAMETANQLIIDLCVVGAKDLGGSSKNVFAEVKLRAVNDGVVGSDHPNAQKSVTKTVKGDLSPKFDHKLRLVVPPKDCIRISLFGTKTIGKEYKGRVDLILSDVVPTLNSGGKATIKSYPVVGEEKRGEVSGTVEVAMRVKGFVSQEAAKELEGKK